MTEPMTANLLNFAEGDRPKPNRCGMCDLPDDMREAIREAVTVHHLSYATVTRWLKTQNCGLSHYSTHYLPTLIRRHFQDHHE